MVESEIIFRTHAILRMDERNVTKDQVRRILSEGEVVREYSDDQPYPSKLILGWTDDRPIHLVAAEVEPENKTIVITVYEPDSDIWSDDFREKEK